MNTNRHNTANRRIMRALARGSYSRAAYHLDAHAKRYSRDYAGNDLSELAAAMRATNA